MGRKCFSKAHVRARVPSVCPVGHSQPSVTFFQINRVKKWTFFFPFRKIGVIRSGEDAL